MIRAGQFSLYVLEDTEVYYGNTAAGYYTGDWEEVLGGAKGKIKSQQREAPGIQLTDTEENVRGLRRQGGNLHIASRSVIFEPEDHIHPILLFPFDVILSSCKPVGVLDMAKSTKSRDGLCFAANYCFVTSHLGVACQHKPLKKAAGRSCKQIFEIPWDITFHSKLNIVLQSYKANTPVPEGLFPPVKFEFTNLGMSEQILLQLDGELTDPLLRFPVCVVLTEKFLYLHSSYTCVPLRKIALQDVLRCERRRRNHKDSAVELQLKKQILLINFNQEADQHRFFRVLVQQPNIYLPKCESLEVMMMGWRDGLISTFDYLMFLNWCAGRTLSDVSCYPVLPWVLQDFSSKTLDLKDKAAYRDLSLPIGALNKDRLKYFQERMRESQEPYLYGTHYSCPGYVVYFLLRQNPEWMLKLHNGEFDKPDRVFDSIETCWSSVSTQPHDLKELIPQFFYGEGDFLKAQQGMVFGKKSTGEGVHPDVALPPWCTSAEDFVRKNREALEGEICGEQIHKWIDLVFGHKARGEQAFQADNLFHPLTYDACEEIEKETNPHVREGLEEQVREFGQCPIQLFSTPHPARTVKCTPSHLIDMNGWAPPTKDIEGIHSSRMEQQAREGVAGVERNAVPTMNSPSQVKRAFLQKGSPGGAGAGAGEHPLITVFNLCLGLIEQHIPGYTEPDPTNCKVTDGSSTFVQGGSSDAKQLLLSINDSEVSSVLYHYFVTENANIVLDDMVWFVPKTGEVFVRRTSAKNFPSKHSPSISWTESIILNVVVQWEYELVVAVVHEPPRHDNTLYAADWFTERVYATPTSSAAHMVDGTDAYCIAYPELVFTADSNMLARIPQGAFLYAIELNAVCPRTGKKVPIRRTAVGHVDLSRHFEADSPTGRTQGSPVDYACIDKSVHVSVKVDEGSTWLNTLKRKKPRECALSCRFCYIAIDRLEVMAAIGANVKQTAATQWLHLPECNLRSAEGKPPKHLPSMVDVDGDGVLCSLVSSVASETGVKQTPSISRPSPVSSISDELERALLAELPEKRYHVERNMLDVAEIPICELDLDIAMTVMGEGGEIEGEEPESGDDDLVPMKEVEERLPTYTADDSTSAASSPLSLNEKKTGFEPLAGTAVHRTPEAKEEMKSSHSTPEFLAAVQEATNGELDESLGSALRKWGLLCSNPVSLSSVSEGVGAGRISSGYMKSTQKKAFSFMQRSYSKRYFVVQGSYIHFFGSNTSNAEAKGSIMVFGAGMAVGYRGSAPNFSLEINPAGFPDCAVPGLDPEDGVFKLAFSKENDRREFCEVLQAGIAQHIM